jgi:BioD-like phosphotransacetylase family protein
MSLVITATKKNAGKTLIGLGIGLHHHGKVGFFKPLGTNLSHGYDEDVLLFKEVFHLKEDPRLFNLSHETDVIALLKSRYTQLSRDKDFMIIESAHTMSYGSYTGLSAPQIAAAMDIPAVVVAEGSPEKIVDKSIIAQHCFEVKDAHILGIIVNKTSHIGRKARIQLEEKGIDILGVIPAYEELNTPTCEDIIEALDGELIAGKEGLSKKVKTTIVGAMTYDSAQRTLQQMAFPENAVMVTGGDRADMQLLALEIKSSLLVLTGHDYPSTTVLARAEELKIPVVRVPYDTMTAASRCEQATARITVSHASLIKDIVRTHVDLKSIFEASQQEG